MSKLIYMVALGDETYHQMARICIKSLRMQGNFDGDILVCTDKRYRPTKLGEIILKVKPQRDVLRIKSLKSRIAPQIDISKYDQVSYIDTDMVAVAEINSMLCARSREIVCASEYPFNTMLREADGSDLFTMKERVRAKNCWGINTGFLCMRSQYFHQYMHLWSATIDKHAHLLHSFIDQPCFNRLVFDKRFPIKVLPYGTIDLPIFYSWSYQNDFKITKTTRLLHIVGNEKKSCLKAMQQISARLGQGCTNKELQEEIVKMLYPYGPGGKTPAKRSKLKIQEEDRYW